MSKIHIFLASSIGEFKEERKEIGNTIFDLNDQLVSEGCYLRLHKCEEVSDAMALGRKQDEYNEIICSCDCFIGLFGRKSGRYTVEEVKTAYENFRKTGKPKMMLYFKSDVKAEEDAEDFADFKRKLLELPGIFCREYEDFAEVKREISFTLKNNIEI